MITPEKLRAGAGTGSAFTAIESHDAAMLADAMEIADSCARADIECHTKPVDIHGAPATRDPGRWWWDIDSLSADERPMIDQALRYLDARGLIEYRTQDGRRLVQFKVPA